MEFDFPTSACLHLIESARVLLVDGGLPPLYYAVDDIDAAKAALGDNLSKIRNAKQPGRRIATLNHKAVGVSVNIAFISPHVPGAIPPVGVKSSL